MRATTRRRSGGSPFGGGAPMPPDVLGILVALFVTFSLQFFQTTAIIPALLRLGPAVLSGFLWQLVTYPFSGFGPVSLWFLLELLIVYWFGRDVFWRLGRRRFWTTLLISSGGGAVVAVVVYLVGGGSGGGIAGLGAFQLMQGQHMMLTVLIAAFATLYGEATILLFFVLPIQARWFLGLEVLFAFLGFLATKDGAGFLGLCTGVALTYLQLTPGGFRQASWKWRTQLKRLWIERKLARLRRRRRFDVIDGDGDSDRWIH